MSRKRKTFDDMLKRCLETPLPRKRKTADQKDQDRQSKQHPKKK